MKIPLVENWRRSNHLLIKKSGALLLALAVFVVAVFLALGSFTAEQSAAATAQRAENNLLRAQRAATRLLAERPAHVQAADLPQVVRTIDQAIAEVTSGGGVVRNQVVRTLGPVTHTKSLRQQERLEIVNLSLEQAFKIAHNLEHGLDACWIETAELTPAPQDRWNLLLEIHWLTYTEESGR